MEASTVMGWLPPGYEPFTNLGLGRDAVVVLSLRHCDRSKDDGRIMETNVTFGWAAVVLQKAGSVERYQGDAEQVYLVELFVDATLSPKLAAFFTAHGWPVVDATLTLGEKQDVVTSRDMSLMYSIRDKTVLPAVAIPFVLPGFRDQWHHVSPNGTIRWAALELDPPPGGEATASLHVQGGHLGNLTRAGVQPEAWQSSGSETPGRIWLHTHSSGSDSA